MYEFKDYRNVKCGDLPSVPTMKQSVCVCVCSPTQCSSVQLLLLLLREVAQF